MRIATKLGLAEFFESEAAQTERYLISCGAGMPADLKARYLRRIHNERVAAHAIRGLTAEQEIEMLEFQTGGPEGSGIESYDNPIKIVSPPLPVIAKPRSLREILPRFFERVDPPYGTGT